MNAPIAAVRTRPAVVPRPVVPVAAAPQNADPEPGLDFGAAAAPQPAPVEQRPSPEPAAGPEPDAEQPAADPEPDVAAARPADDGKDAVEQQPKTTKGRGRKTGRGKQPTKASTPGGTKTLVVVENGEVSYADEAVHVLDLDALRDGDVDLAVQALTGLADVVDSDGKADAVNALLAKVKALTVG